MNQSFAEFILKNKEVLRSRFITYQHVRIKETLFEKSSVIKKVVYNSEIVTKWSNCIWECFGSVKLSKEFSDVLSIYCEVISMYRKSNMPGMYDYNGYQGERDRAIYQESAKELKRILGLLNSKGNRSKIIDTYYNHNTGKPEYLLEDGTYIPKEEGLKRELELDLSVLPNEFLPIIDDVEYRNKKIDEING